MNCIFCKIINREAESSIIYEDDICIAFMDIRPVNTGQCMVIPKDHIDHFTDVDDETAAHIMVIGQKIARQMLKTLTPKPLRIGYVVHGFGAPHAHLVIVPQHHEDDITSMKMLEIRDNQIVPDWYLLPAPERGELDQVAAKLKIL